MSEKVVLHFWRIVLQSRILGWWLLQHKIVHFLLVNMISEQLNVIFTFVSLYVGEMFFPLASFRILSLIFCNLKMIYLRYSFSGIYLFWYSEFPESVICYLALIWGKILVIIVLNFSSFFWYSNTFCSCPTVIGYCYF